jgi:hypothetical protein
MQSVPAEIFGENAVSIGVRNSAKLSINMDSSAENVAVSETLLGPGEGGPKSMCPDSRFCFGVFAAVASDMVVFATLIVFPFSLHCVLWESTRFRPGRFVAKYSHLRPRLSHLEHIGFSFGHLTFDKAQE